MPERWQRPDNGSLFPGSLVAVAALLLLVLWAMMSPSDGASSSGQGPRGGVAVVLVFLGTFGFLAFKSANRRTVMIAGALACLTLGIVVRFYFPSDAASYLYGKLDTLVLLAGVSTVTTLLEASGFFEVLAAKTLATLGARGWRVMAGLCALTFVLSMFVNNLAAILVIIPLSLRIAHALKLDAVSLVLGEVIASNLGGASTMVGDFPNMLIATETGTPFHEFVYHLAPICLLQLGILIVFLSPAFKGRPSDSKLAPKADPRAFAVGPWNRELAARGLVILSLMVLGFLVTGWSGIPPAWIAGAGAGMAFLFGNVPWRRLLHGICWEEVLFFACLFVMVGAVNAAGVLDELGLVLGSVWLRSPLFGALALAWGAAGLTAILNAGPTTALLLHIIMTALGPVAPQETMWWALSLGVCAGSSATLTGATAGPVAAGLLKRHGVHLSFSRFARTGIPLMFAFLMVSSCYLAILVSQS